MQTLKQIENPNYMGLSTDDKYSDWTTFENKDKELKEKILAFPKPTSFYYFGKTWEIGEREGSEIKCTSGRDVSYFNVKDVQRYAGEKHLANLMKEFDPIKEFFKQFGTLYFLNEYGDIHKNDYGCQIRVLTDGNYGFNGMNSFGSIWKREYLISASKENISIKREEYGNIAFIEWDENGDFINRDYNEKLQLFSQSLPDMTKVFSKVESVLKIIAKENFQGKENSNIFFGKDYRYSLTGSTSEFYLTGIRKREYADGYQEYSGATIYKMPKTLKTIDSEKVTEIFLKEFEKVKPNLLDFK